MIKSGFGGLKRGFRDLKGGLRELACVNHTRKPIISKPWLELGMARPARRNAGVGMLHSSVATGRNHVAVFFIKSTFHGP